MKKNSRLCVMLLIVIGLSSCSIFRGKAKSGCPSNGKNVGAEKLASGDPKAEKLAKKAGKFKYNKIPTK
jgi:hypothetical protein